MAWLLDTNVLSELRRPKPEPKVVAFVAARPLGRLYISVITLAEFRFGIELVSEPNLVICEGQRKCSGRLPTGLTTIRIVEAVANYVLWMPTKARECTNRYWRVFDLGREQPARKSQKDLLQRNGPEADFSLLIGIPNLDYFASNNRDIANTSRATDTHANQSPRNR